MIKLCAWAIKIDHFHNKHSPINFILPLLVPSPATPRTLLAGYTWIYLECRTKRFPFFFFVVLENEYGKDTIKLNVDDFFPYLFFWIRKQAHIYSKSFTFCYYVIIRCVIQSALHSSLIHSVYIVGIQLYILKNWRNHNRLHRDEIYWAVDNFSVIS